MLNKCIKRKRYLEAVRIGYSVSRAFFLSGRNEERYKISEKVFQALKPLEGTIVLNKESHNVELLKAQLLIDDCGWSLYLLKPFENQQAAENRIKDGIILCLNIAASQQDEAMTYYTAYRGLRHLFAMVIHNFEDVSKETLKHNPSLLEDYISKIHNYGGLLGYILNDPVMIDSLSFNDCLNIFSNITMGAKNSHRYLTNLRAWCIKKLSARDYLWFSSYSARIRYSLGIIKAYQIENKAYNKEKYLNHAKSNAIMMTIGYATDKKDYDWLNHTSFANDLNIYSSYSCVQPDPERFVKGYVLLGTVAMVSGDQQSLFTAETVFTKAIEESKRVNRIDAFIAALSKLITVREQICYLQLQKGNYDKPDKQDKIGELIKSIEKYETDSKEFLGYSDPKIKAICKAKKKEYKAILKSYREDYIRALSEALLDQE